MIYKSSELNLEIILVIKNFINFRDTLKSFVSDYKMKRKPKILNISSSNQENLAKVNKPEYFSQYLRFMLSPRTKFTYDTVNEFSYLTSYLT